MKKKIKSVHSYRLDDELLKKAKKKKINVRLLIEETLKQMLESPRCPLCGQGE